MGIMDYLKGMGMLSVSYLPSSMKISLYRLLGARIGDDVVFDIGSYILPKGKRFSSIDLGDRCLIEKNVVVVGASNFRMGRESLIARDTRILGDHSFILGDKSNIGYGNFIDLNEDVIIGREVSVASYSLLITHSLHKTDKFEISSKAPIRIQDGAWLGAGSRILAGVTIGENSAVGAGAVVVKDVPPEEVHAGVPATKIKDTFQISQIRYKT